MERLHPNFFTFFGLLVSTFSLLALATGYWIMGGILILISGIFDLLDGASARITYKVTIFGGFFDSVIDRYSDTFYLTGFLIYYFQKANINMMLLTSMVSIGVLLVPYARARSENILTSSCKVGITERGDRIVLLSMGAIFNIMPIVLFILLFLSHVTVFQRIVYTWKEIKRIKVEL